MKKLSTSVLTIVFLIVFSNALFSQTNNEDFDYRAYYQTQIDNCEEKLDGESDSMTELMKTTLEQRIVIFENMIIAYDEMMEMEEEDYYIDMGADFQNLSPAQKIKILERQYEMDLISESNYLEAKAKLERQ